MATSRVESGSTRFELWCKGQLQDIAEARPGTRAGGPQGEGFDAAEFRQANLLSVQFTDGSILFTDPEAFALRYGVTAGRAGAAGARVVLPFVLQPGAAARAGHA